MDILGPDLAPWREAPNSVQKAPTEKPPAKVRPPASPNQSDSCRKRKCTARRRAAGLTIFPSEAPYRLRYPEPLMPPANEVDHAHLAASSAQQAHLW